MSESVFIETRGTGPALVMLHGWGLHGGIWGKVTEALAERFTLYLVDLPGHGRSPLPAAPYTLDTLVAVLREALPANACWLGWSLGGRIALAAAAAGVAISRLVLVGTNPCFTQRPDWPHAMAPAELERFAAGLREDYRGTLLRFVALQSRGSSQGREELRSLRAELFAHGEPDPAALTGGLAILSGADLRPALAAIGQPTLVMHGERDNLAPPAAAEFTAATLPHGQFEMIAGAGHAPFLSHPEQFVAAIEGFCHG